MAHAHFNLPHALRSKSVSTELKRQIGIRTATAFVVGGVIGVGIFLTPAGMAKSLGSPLAAGRVADNGRHGVVRRALLRRVGRALSRSWRRLRLPSRSVGPAIAFMYGWMAFLVMDPGLTAVLAVGRDLRGTRCQSRHRELSRLR